MAYSNPDDPLVNPLPVIDEFTELAFRRSRKLIAFKHDRRLAKRQLD